MKNNSAGEKLLLFLVILFVGMLVANLTALSPYLLAGHTFESIQNDPSIIYKGPASLLRTSLFLNQFFSFLLPSLIFGYFFYKNEFFKGFDLNKMPPLVYLALALLFLFASYPLVNLAHYINMQIPLADWMYTNENNVAEMLNKIIRSDSYIVLGLNILLISLLPALGEEMVFRGILQKYMERIFKNGHIAIWISALLFSAIHMQFEGFLARMTLGAVLGYSYYLSRNFWVPVILHFLNNLLPLLALAILNKDLTQNIESSDSFIWSTLILPILGLPILFYLFKRYNDQRNFI